MRPFIDIIGSRRFAIYLLILTTSVILLSNFLPNQSILTSREIAALKKERPVVYALSTVLGIKTVTRSPYFQIIPVFIFLSVSVCTIRRLKWELERMESGRALSADLPVRHSLDVGVDREEFVSELRKRRWRVIEAEDGPVIYASKGERGVWGSFAFHFGMNMVLLGILVSATTGTDGILSLTEGFPVSTPAEIRGLRVNKAKDFPFSEVMLDSFLPIISGGFPIEFDSRVAGVGRDGRLRKYVIGVNRPLKVGDYKFIYKEANFAPRFVLRKKDGDVLADVVTNLYIPWPGEVDNFDIPEQGLRVTVEHFPNHYVENGVHKTMGVYPKNSVLYVKVEQDGKMIGGGFLVKGERGSFEDYTLEYAELKYCVNIIVSRDAGVPIIVFGFLLITLGLSFRFVLNEKEVWFIMSSQIGHKAGIGGKARYFPAMFEDELNRLAEELGHRGMK